MKKKRLETEDDGPSILKPLLGLFAVSLLLRLAHLWLFQDDFWFKTPLLDDNIFVSWADVIAREGLRAPSLGIFNLNPAYAYVLSLIGKSPGVVFTLQHLAGSLVPIMLFLVTEKAFGRKAAWVSGIAAAFYGPAFFYESRFLGEFWIYFFNTGAVLLLMMSWGRERPYASWALSGLCAGLSAVFRPNVLAVLPPASLAWALWTLRDRRVLAGCLALWLLCLWLPMLPFQLRNRAVDPSHGWGLTTASGGVNLYLGNNPEADGLNKAPSFIRYGPGHEYEDFRDEAKRLTGKELRPAEVSRFWTGRTLRWMRERPRAALRLTASKAGFFWNHREPPDNFFSDVFDRFTRLGGVPLLAWGLVAPLGLAGLLLTLRDPAARRSWILHAYVLLYFGVNVMFYILSRYRFPAAVGLIPFAAYAAVRARSAACLAVVLACFGLSRLHLIGDEDAAVTHYSKAVIYANQGWKEQAVQEYRASLAADPQFKAAYLNLGILQTGRGEFEEALWALENTLRLEQDPERAKTLQQHIGSLRGLAGPPGREPRRAPRPTGSAPPGRAPAPGPGPRRARRAGPAPDWKREGIPATASGGPPPPDRPRRAGGP